MEMLAAIHELTPDGKPAPPEEPWIAESEPSLVELAIRSTINNVQQPFRFAKILREAAPPAIKAFMERAREKDDEDAQREVPRTRFNGRVSPHRVFEASSFSLDDVKQIRKRIPGATVNDVILAIVGGGLRKYLEHHLELPIDTLSAFAPISTRTTDQAGTAGNQVSGMFVALHTDEADPVKRLEKVYRTTTSSKEMAEAIGARSMTDVTQTMPGALAGIAGRLVARTGLMSRMKPVAHCVVTNVPGPQVPMYFTGAKMVGSFGLGLPMEGIGLFHCVMSYNGAITVSVTACRDQMPDPSFYAECIEASFGELREAAVS
jgi:WS/DGAT/MGAT family acyltransferase